MATPCTKGGKVDYIDNCYAGYFSTFTLDRVLNVMKIPLPMGYAYRRSRLNLTHGLIRLATDQHVAEMLQDIGPTRTVDMYLIPPVVPHYLPWDYSITFYQHIPEPDLEKRKGVVITDLEDGKLLEPLLTSRLVGATEVEEISSEKEMSSEESDEDWDFNWMGKPESHVVITELDDEPEVQDQTTYDVTTGVEPQVGQPNVTTGVEDEHCNEHTSPFQYNENFDFNWDEPIVNKSDEGDNNSDEPIVDQSDHIDFNLEELGLETVGDEHATEQPVQQGTEPIECNWDEPAVDNVHSDYGLSDELKSLNSDEDADEPRRRVREPIFNPKTDMSDPQFALAPSSSSEYPNSVSASPNSVFASPNSSSIARTKSMSMQKIDWHA
ncbi:hypothetical protein Fot_53269 [Forsythia ovata]|uniref:Uncharacterized protein n=1 Tax=Forsythia ovata TaxID=205694 RepID=A0ABD1PJR6_9LAMI